MRLEPGDLVSINGAMGWREFNPNKLETHMDVVQGQRAIVLEMFERSVYSKMRIYYKVLTVNGVWYMHENLLSQVRLTFRQNELDRVARFMQRDKTNAT